MTVGAQRTKEMNARQKFRAGGFNIRFLEEVEEDRESMKLCEASGGHVLPVVSGRAWKCIPSDVHESDTHDCTTMIEPLPEFIACKEATSTTPPTMGV